MCGTSEEMIFRHDRSWIPDLQVGAGRRIGTVLQGLSRVLLDAKCPPNRPQENRFDRRSSQIRCLAWRRGGDSNPRSHKGSRDFESRRLNQTPEPLRNRSAFTFAYTQSRKSIREKPWNRKDGFDLRRHPHPSVTGCLGESTSEDPPPWVTLGKTLHDMRAGRSIQMVGNTPALRLRSSFCRYQPRDNESRSSRNQGGDDVQFPEGAVPVRHTRNWNCQLRRHRYLQLAPRRHGAGRSREQQPTDRQVFAARSNLLVSLGAQAALAEESSHG